MTPYVTDVRRVVIELPAHLECQMLRAHMDDAGFRSFTHMLFESLQGHQCQDSGTGTDDLHSKSDAGFRPINSNTVLTIKGP